MPLTRFAPASAFVRGVRVNAGGMGAAAPHGGPEVVHEATGGTSGGVDRPVTPHSLPSRLDLATRTPSLKRERVSASGGPAIALGEGRAGGRAAAAPAPSLDLTKQHITENPTVQGPAEGHHAPLRGAGPGEGGSLLDAEWEAAIKGGRRVDGLREGYLLRGRWLKEPGYAALRNAAWLVRNSRHGEANNPLALRVVVVEVQRLISQGEGLPDIVEALCELMLHP